MRIKNPGFNSILARQHFFYFYIYLLATFYTTDFGTISLPLFASSNAKSLKHFSAVESVVSQLVLIVAVEVKIYCID